MLTDSGLVNHIAGPPATYNNRSMMDRTSASLNATKLSKQQILSTLALVYGL